MAKEGNKPTKIVKSGAPFGGAYFLTFIGAAVYFMHHAFGFWGFVVALLKACVWPAFVVYRALTLLHVSP